MHAVKRRCESCEWHKPSKTEMQAWCQSMQVITSFEVVFNLRFACETFSWKGELSRIQEEVVRNKLKPNKFMEINATIRWLKGRPERGVNIFLFEFASTSNSTIFWHPSLPVGNKVISDKMAYGKTALTKAFNISISFSASAALYITGGLFASVFAPGCIKPSVRMKCRYLIVT